MTLYGMTDALNQDMSLQERLRAKCFHTKIFVTFAWLVLLYGCGGDQSVERYIPEAAEILTTPIFMAPADLTLSEDTAGHSNIAIVSHDCVTRPTSGEYILLDEEGVLGRVVPHHIDRNRNGVSFRVEFELKEQWTRTPQLVGSSEERLVHSVVIGPLHRSFLQARLMALGLQRSGLVHTSPPENPGRDLPRTDPTYCVDLVGDRRCDIAFYWEIEIEGQEGHFLISKRSMETWNFTSRGWSRVEHGSWEERSLVGP